MVDNRKKNTRIACAGLVLAVVTVCLTIILWRYAPKGAQIKKFIPKYNEAGQLEELVAVIGL